MKREFWTSICIFLWGLMPLMVVLAIILKLAISFLAKYFEALIDTENKVGFLTELSASLKDLRDSD